ncbi:hypothetical protein C1T17_16585 [Sphingobium sp. SCG-1]|nr:hypothetical protein C1T17_16585 [Sphingobium sp. SCG-1]
MAVVMGTVAAILPLQAQIGGGFQGNVTSSVGLTGGGGPSVFRSGTTDTISVFDRETIIDWQPFDNGNNTGPIGFLPEANSVTFQTGVSSTLTDYTVLNRINSSNPNRIVDLSGQITSQINGTPGGAVWFYSPGGFVVGSTAVFNVGSLMMTSNQVDVTGGLFGTGNTIRFRGAPGSLSRVTINSGAQINGTAANSYVALVAPRVVQGGTVTVNGSTAYVGAEQADIRINNGLFDIDITAGTTDSQGVNHTGTTTGPAPLTFSDRQNIYMVAVPKNNALTMLLSGTIGYQSAVGVTQDSSAVVLSAGYSIQNNAVSGNVDLLPPTTATGAASITLGSGNIRSALSLNALDDATIAPTATLQFDRTSSINAGNSIAMTAAAGASITALGDLNLRAGIGATGGSVTLAANGVTVTPSPGEISVVGALNVNTEGSGNDDFLDATGGPVSFTANGGTISAGTLVVDTSGNAAMDTTRSGNATGGNVGLTVSNGGQMTFATTTINALGNSIFNAQTLPTDGGNAAGGTITFSGTGGALNLGEVRATASATGGSATSGKAGNATSGNIIVNLSSGTHNWALFYGDVSATAGFSRLGQGTAGSVIPGTTGISVDVTGTAALNIAQSVSLYGMAYNFGGNDVAGVTRAAPIRVQARNGGAISITQDLTIQSAGIASNRSFGSGGNVSNNAFGGTALIGALGGTFTMAGLNVYAGAEGGGGTFSGSATGGNVTLAASNSNGLRGNLSITDCINFACAINVSAIGGGGSSSGIGGTILAYASDADLAVNGLSLSAEGRGGNSSQLASTGIGGSISIESRRGALNNGTLSLGDFSASASATPQLQGESSNLSNGDASGGQGGSVTLALEGGTFTANAITLAADGTGADAGASFGTGTPFVAGEGAGGTVDVQLAGANATIGTLFISANGTGGQAEGVSFDDTIPAISGTGRGGTARFTAAAGTLSVDTLTVQATGTGGSARNNFQADAADGFDGVGGTAQFVMDTGSSATVNVRGITTPQGLVGLTVSADGAGGAGGTTEVDGSGLYRAGMGGSGTGGTADFLLAGGALNTPVLVISATGTGGNGGRNGSDGAGGAAGNGFGGAAQFTFASEGHNITGIGVSAGGRGGVAGDAKEIVGYDQFDDPIYAFGIGAGGAGGSGTGGRASMRIDVDPTFSFLQVSANSIGTVGGNGGTGGNGGAAFGGANGMGAELAVNFGSLTVSNLEVTADAFSGAGGNGATGRGGDGGISTAGEAGLIITGGNTQVQTNFARVSSYALGGDGGDSGTTSGDGLTGGSGGAAFGGTAGILVADNAQYTLGQSTIVASGGLGGTGRIGTPSTIAGNGGDGGNGGSATGGTAQFVVQNATVIDGADGTVEIFAGALAGVSGGGASDGGLVGLGGDAVGGLAQFQSEGGAITLNTMSLDASASGSRNAQGGTASADFFGFVGTALPASGSATFASLNLNADAYASALTGGPVGLGGIGGNAVGGTAAATVDGAGTVTRFDAFSATARAFGGGARLGLNAGTAGANGGTATGGRARFVATGNSQTTLGSSFSLLADATGGDGGAGIAGATGGAGGNGGAAIAGDARFTIEAAQVRTNGGSSYTLSALGTGGAGGIGGDGTGSAGGVGGTGGDGTGGLARFEATDGDFDLPAISILANGTGGLGGAGGNGPATPSFPPAPSAAGLSGSGIGGIAQLSNGGTGSFAQGAQRTLAEVTMQANGIFPSGSTSGFGPTAGRVDITDTSTAAGGGLVVNGALTAETFGDASCNCSGIFVSSDANPISVGAATLTSSAPISFSFSGGGSFRSLGSLDVTSDSMITVAHSNPLAADSLFGDTVTLHANGDVRVGAGSLIRSAGAMEIISQAGAVDVAQLASGGNIAVSANTDASFGNAVTAAGALQITAQGTARFAGQTTASTINVTSGDIVIGNGARLGQQGTTGSITLSASFGQGRNYIGGGDQAGAYSLSGDEMTWMFAQNIAILPQAQSTIGSFTLTSGTNGNLGPNGVLTIDSRGRMEVVGALRLTGLGTAGGLTLRAGNGMDVFTDTASIDLRGNGTALGGVLIMEAPSIAVATRSAVDGITGVNVPLDTRDARLAQNDGNVNDDGFLRAGAIRLAASGIYIQNSGVGTAYADRRGFTANSLSITGGGPNTEIVINGRFLNSAGAFVTGVNAIALVSINGVAGGQIGSFAALSTANGCLIANVANCAVVTPPRPEIPPVLADNRDAIDRVLNPEDPSVALRQIFPVAIVELRDFVAEGFPPLIDEPVTGAGNEDLWDSDCSVSGDQGCSAPPAQ